MTYILDASALLRFTDKEPGFDRIRELLHAAARGEAEILLSAVNWGEIVSVLHRKHPQNAGAILGHLGALPITIVAVDAAAAAEAGVFRCRNNNVPYADAFAGALALSCSERAQRAADVTLVTADYDFKNVPKGTIRIEFLPPK